MMLLQAGAPSVLLQNELLGSIVWAAALVLCLVIIAATCLKMLRLYLGRRSNTLDYASEFSSELTNVSTVILAARFASAVVAMRYEKKQGEYEHEAIDRLVSQFIVNAINPAEAARLKGLRILWAHKVDVHDVFEKRVFRSLGVEVKFCLTTKGAAEELEATSGKPDRYDLVISNMRRPNALGEADDDNAGFALLHELRQKINSKVPTFSIPEPPARGKRRKQNHGVMCTGRSQRPRSRASSKAAKQRAIATWP